jgi:hypothetical protein
MVLPVCEMTADNYELFKVWASKQGVDVSQINPKNTIVTFGPAYSSNVSKPMLPLI